MHVQGIPAKRAWVVKLECALVRYSARAAAAAPPRESEEPLALEARAREVMEEDDARLGRALRLVDEAKRIGGETLSSLALQSEALARRDESLDEAPPRGSIMDGLKRLVRRAKPSEAAPASSISPSAPSPLGAAAAAAAAAAAPAPGAVAAVAPAPGAAAAVAHAPSAAAAPSGGVGRFWRSAPRASARAEAPAAKKLVTGKEKTKKMKKDRGSPSPDRSRVADVAPAPSPVAEEESYAETDAKFAADMDADDYAPGMAQGDAYDAVAGKAASDRDAYSVPSAPGSDGYAARASAAARPAAARHYTTMHGARPDEADAAAQGALLHEIGAGGVPDGDDGAPVDAVTFAAYAPGVVRLGRTFTAKVRTREGAARALLLRPGVVISMDLTVD